MKEFGTKKCSLIFNFIHTESKSGRPGINLSEKSFKKIIRMVIKVKLNIHVAVKACIYLEFDLPAFYFVKTLVTEDS